MARSGVGPEQNHSDFWIGGVSNYFDRSRAIDALTAPGLVAQENQGVFALWLVGGDNQALDELVRVKGGSRRKKTLSLAGSFFDYAQYIDPLSLPENLSGLSPQELGRFLSGRLGSLAFARLPITREARDILPSNTISFAGEGDPEKPFIQIWDPIGNPHTNAFLKEAKQEGIAHMCVTSLNKPGEPEITTRESAEAFCRDANIPLLYDNQANAREGSYPIIVFRPNGVYLARKGNTSDRILSRALELEIHSDASTVPNKYGDAADLQPPLNTYSGVRARVAAIALNLRGEPETTAKISKILDRWRDR